jgi:hypothetical protein
MYIRQIKKNEDFLQNIFNAIYKLLKIHCIFKKLILYFRQK